MMKAVKRLAIVMLFLTLVSADKHCQNLADQCNLLKSTCSPAMIFINSCCNLTIFPLSAAPSNVCQIMKFTTRDNENDSWPHWNCAVFYSAGWWFGDRCPDAQMNLNRSPPYLAENPVFVEMKIHPKNCIMA